MSAKTLGPIVETGLQATAVRAWTWGLWGAFIADAFTEAVDGWPRWVAFGLVGAASYYFGVWNSVVRGRASYRVQRDQANYGSET